MRVAIGYWWAICLDSPFSLHISYMRPPIHPVFPPLCIGLFEACCDIVQLVRLHAHGERDKRGLGMLHECVQPRSKVFVEAAELLSRDIPGRLFAGGCQNVRELGQFGVPVPLLQLRQGLPHLSGLRSFEIHVLVQPPVGQRGGVVVGQLDGTACGQQPQQAPGKQQAQWTIEQAADNSRLT